jgi:MEDS: MEthanogen/methylotroph, DcmR Sensory domain
MEISRALVTGLTALSGGSTDPASDLPKLVQALQDALLNAVPSGLGLSITIPVDPSAVTVTTLNGTATVESSLRVSLPALAGTEVGSAVVFYAGNAGALVDLAADLQWALHLPADALLLDRHLTSPVRYQPIAGLHETSVVQQALGALLAQGRTPEAAAQHLRTIADRSGVSVLTAASELVRPPDPRPTRTADTPATQELDFAALRFGVPWDGSAQPGDHICALYRGPDERSDLLAPYLQAGLHAGEKCLCMINPPDRTVIVNRLATDGTISDHLKSDQLEIHTPTDVYLAAGEFLAEQMTSFLTDTITAAETTGYQRFRAAGDMSWLHHRPPGIDQYLGYESNLNRITRHPTLMCMYDLDDLDQDLLNNLLRTHPTVLHNGETMPSPYYQDPDQNPAVHA